MTAALDKHPVSGALLLNPLRQLSKCDACCGNCEYAIRAEPCNQVLEDCDPTIGPLWFCVESRCFEAEQNFGQIKTPVVFLYTAPGDIERCWQTIPESVTLASKLDPEIDLITDTGLECIEEGCASEVCGDPDEAVCECICRSTDLGLTDCCMSRLVDGVAPWTFTWTQVIEDYVERENRDGGLLGGGCVSADCRESLSCVFFRVEREIDYASLTTPIEEQGCTKIVPVRERETIKRVGLEPPAPQTFACCSEADSATNTWVPIDDLLVNPPGTVPHDVQVTDGTLTTEDGCISNTKETLTREGDCTFYEETLVEELWTYAIEGGVCKCQEYQRRTTVTRYDFFPANDELSLRLCEQCDRSEP